MAANDRKALVLSGGGQFAAYQAGVYRALWPHWKPDLVVGVSAGALNAWLIAGGITPDCLMEEWRHPESAGVMKARRIPSLWNGYYDAGPLREHARRVQREYPRQLPLGVAAVDVPRCRPKLFCDDEITAEHLVASCAIPLLYPPVRIGGSRLIDGGVFDPTPVWAAAQMGATEAVAVDCLPQLWTRRMVRVLTAVSGVRRAAISPELKVNWIRPSGWLGGVRDAMVWSRENVERWVEMGIRDGEEFLRKR